MIRSAIEYITNLAIEPSKRLVKVVQGGATRDFVINNEGNPIEVKTKISRARDAMLINTLTGLVAYIKASLERSEAPLYLQVVDERTVHLKGTLDEEGGRETLVTVNAIVPNFAYGRFHEAEELIIALQSKFTSTVDRDLLLKVVGNVKEENVRQTGDNGFAQAVTIKTGVASVDDVIVPNPVNLAPYRTFLEVAQPASDFIFRMKDGPVGAVFEADGGAWRNEAIHNISEFLAEQLADEVEASKITIIA